MFTGIITAIGTIRELRAIGDGRDMRLAIGIPGSAADVALGASIACSGCCLTVIERDADWFAVEVSADFEQLASSAPAASTMSRRFIER